MTRRNWEKIRKDRRNICIIIKSFENSPYAIIWHEGFGICINIILETILVIRDNISNSFCCCY